ncbi:bacillithiol biosynthesis cysteine-adding enzyme BshC [bacterium]|nr:bacillithiol biosynthesis cysteine-adding enzyme BshC [bacterium]
MRTTLHEDFNIHDRLPKPRWPDLCDAVRHHPASLDASRRVLVAEAIDAQYRKCGLEPPASAFAQFKEGAPTITTGHQLVLAGGPAFFHYKIWTAIRLARQVMQAGVADSVVPVFWMASEDHDFDEIAGLPASPDDWGQLRGVPPLRGWQPEDPFRGQAAVGRISVTDSLRRFVETWAESAGWSLAEREAWSAACAEPATVLADVIRRWVHGLYGGEGLLIIDGDDPALKRAASFLFEAEWTGNGIHDAVVLDSQALADLGKTPPVFPRKSMLFRLEGSRGLRQRLTPELTTEEPFPGAQHLSPNALLRPLYQEFLLQNVAMVGGATECAYWFQLPQAFAQHGLSMPLVWLRDSVTLLSPSADQTLHPFTPRDPGFRHPEAAEAAWIQHRLSASTWQAAREAQFRALAELLGEEAAHIDPTLRGAAHAAAARMQKEWRKVEQRMRRAIRRQDAEPMARFVAAHQLVRPNGIPQERQWNLFQLVHGLSSTAEPADLFSAYLEATAQAPGPSWVVVTLD